MRLDFLGIDGITQKRLASVTIEDGQVVVTGRLSDALEKELAELYEQHPKQFFKRAAQQYSGTYLRAAIVDR